MWVGMMRFLANRTIRRAVIVVGVTVAGALYGLDMTAIDTIVTLIDNVQR